MKPIDHARQCFERGAFGEAIEALRRIPTPDIDDEARLVLGVSLARLRRGPEAIEAFTDLLSRDPDCFTALTWMAILKRSQTESQESIGLAKRAIELRPEDASAHGVLGSCLLYVNQSLQAIESFQRAIQLAPHVAEHHHNLAMVYLQVHKHREAVECLKRSLELEPNNQQSYLSLSSEYLRYGLMGQAIDCLSEGLSRMPNSAALHSAAGNAFNLIRNDAAAERHHRRAIELSPTAQGAFATWLLNQGRFAESTAVCESMLKGGQSPALAYYGMVQAKKITQNDVPLVSEMEQLLGEKRLSPPNELYLRYALGKAYEQLGAFGTAIAHYDEANRLSFAVHNAGSPFSPEKTRQQHDKLTRCYERIPDLGPDAKSDETPLFIVGMIRSGTTLLDQILSSHPMVASAGELRFWMEESRRLIFNDEIPENTTLRALADEYISYIEMLTDGAARITDKMPMNFANIGLIHRALPNARFVHIRRDPLDTCLSIYTTYLGNGTQFAYNKSNIISYYREYQRMMAYWRTEIPKNRLLEIDYEELISTPETLIPKIIDFCGLPWDEACLHHDQNRTAINTPSRWQARQPMYKSSLDRWRNYEPWLGEFGELR